MHHDAHPAETEGNLISDRMGILERWVEYFDELLNNQNIGELKDPPTEGDGQILPPSSIEETTRSIKNHKSLGADGITAELVKYGGDNYTKRLINLCYSLSILIIPKQRGKADFRSYEHISAMS